MDRYESCCGEQSTVVVTSIQQAKSKNVCGWCCFRPNFLQSLATSKWFLFWMCWAGSFQSFLINGLLNVSVSTIERRYELSSTDTGIIVGVYDISSFLSLLPISYLGGRKGACKPKWVGYGILLLGIGSFAFASPHFVSGLYQTKSERNQISTCSSSAALPNSTCANSKDTDGLLKQEQLTLQQYKYVFLFAQLIMGVGGSPLYTLGTAFIDENVTNKMQPVYSGVFFACTMLGPALGYMVGGQLLRIYVDIGSVHHNDIQITPESDIWVGAWWLGFVIIGVLLCLASVPLLAFPSELPGTKELMNSEAKGGTVKSREVVSDTPKVICETRETEVDSETKLPVLSRDFLNAIKDLWKRWTFLFVCLEHSCSALLLAGFGAFVPKIIESQFNVSPSIASLIVGGLVIPCGCGASYLGGYLIKKFSMAPRGILKLSCFIVFANFLCSAAFAIYCPNIDFVGVTTPYNDQRNESKTELLSTCNKDCSCASNVYDPICGTDNKVYYSPCYAGCGGSHQIEDQSSVRMGFSNCSCIPQHTAKWMRVEDGREFQISAERKKCTSTKCTYQIYLFTALFFLFLGLIFLNSMPMLSATLRSVPSDRRAFALGIQMIIWRLLGAIPGPIIFGWFIDSACMLWKSVDDGYCDGPSTNSGSCLAYDNLTLSRAMLLIALTVEALACVFAGLAWGLYVPAEHEQRKDLPNEEHTENAPSSENFTYNNSIQSSEYSNPS